MTIPYRPLGHVRDLVNAMGLEVTYAYEDLVHVEHNAFLLQMGDSGEIVNLYFNTDSAVDERDKIADRLRLEGKARQLIIDRKGLFSMRQKSDGENIEIHFFDGKQ